MTSLSDDPAFATNLGAVPTARRTRAPFAVSEARWGYVVRGPERPSLALSIAQATTWVLGLLLMLFALALAIASVDGASTLWMRLGLAGHLATASLVLWWFASRGSVAEVEVDLQRGEVREVVPHRAGRPGLLASHGFDAVAAVVVERNPGAQAALVLRVSGSTRPLLVAHGSEAALAPLRRRLEADLMPGVMRFVAPTPEAEPDLLRIAA